jgi:hypothetical protein
VQGVIELTSLVATDRIVAIRKPHELRCDRVITGLPYTLRHIGTPVSRRQSAQFWNSVKLEHRRRDFEVLHNLGVELVGSGAIQHPQWIVRIARQLDRREAGMPIRCTLLSRMECQRHCRVNLSIRLSSALFGKARV